MPRSRPTPRPPGDSEDDQDDGRRDEVNEQRGDGLPKWVAFVEDVESKHAQEEGEQKGEDAGGPVSS